VVVLEAINNNYKLIFKYWFISDESVIIVMMMMMNMMIQFV